MRSRGLLGPALSVAAFGLLAYVFARDLVRWRTGRPHLPAAADAALLIIAAGALALASTLFVRLWARMLARQGWSRAAPGRGGLDTRSPL